MRKGLRRLWEGVCSVARWIDTANMVLEALIFAVIVIAGVGIGIYRCVGNVLP
jgi:hypothetical protein